MPERIGSRSIVLPKSRPLDYVAHRPPLVLTAPPNPSVLGGAGLAEGTRPPERTLPADRPHSRSKRLWSAQRLVLLLVLLYVAGGLFIALAATVSGAVNSVADLLVLASWFVVWFISSIAVGSFSPFSGFSRRRETVIASLVLSIRSGASAIAVCVVFGVILGQEPSYRELIEVIAALSLFSGTARVFLAGWWPPRVLVVTVQTETIPADYGPNVTFRHLPVSTDLLDDPALLVATIAEAAKAFDASSVEIVGDVGLSGQLWRSLSWELREQHASLSFAVAGGPLRQRRVQSTVTGPRVVLEISAPTQPRAVKWGKRSADIVCSICLILVLSPVLVAVALLVKLTSPGPALYRQERVGKDGALFNILKFRSMDEGSDSQLQSLLQEQDKTGTPLFKVDNDPRITRVGAFLRRYSLDELPQLFNVLGGSMSLVGPRPQRPAEVALYRGDAAHRLGVPPGMTGLWQVSGRSRLTWEESQQLDVDYAHNWSLGEDLHILARTARAVFEADGAQ